ncbi:MAG: NAD(P)H-hydrate dehydratase, partial [Leptospiraceae bacterium]|nr:NAD(P)H-hydrate dehydratase [Leptospiraceae bacterium]
GTHSNEYKFYLEKAKALDIPILELENFLEIHPNWENIFLIDCLLGTGFKPPLSELYTKIVEKVNQVKQNYPKLKILSVDSLSGFSILDSPTFIKADFLAEVGVKKIENLYAKHYCKNYSLHPISFPVQKFIQKSGIQSFLLKRLSKKQIQKLVQRRFDSHKYSNGYAILIGGSDGMSGAILLSQKAFHISGGGFSKIYTPSERTIQIGLKRNPSFLYEKLTENLMQETVWSKVTSVVIGPGLKPEEFSFPIIEILIKQDKYIIIDAGGLSIIKQKTLSDKVLLTPHRGEFQNLIDKKPSTEKEWLDELKKYATQYNCNILLKGHVSILALSNGEFYFFPYSNPKLSVMGTGDLLSGILGFSCYKLDSIQRGVQFALSFLHLSKKMKIKFPTALEILKYLEEIKL